MESGVYVDEVRSNPGRGIGIGRRQAGRRIKERLAFTRNANARMTRYDT